MCHSISMIAPRSNADQDVICLLRTARVIFWDFDGVIKDSVTAKSDGFEQLFLPYGKEVASRVREHHEANGGVSRYEKIPVYLSWAGESVTGPTVQEFCDRFSNLVLQAVIDSPWVPGVREYLQKEHLHQPFVLLSATPQEEIQHILEALNIASCFQAVHGAPMSKAAAICDELRHLQCPAKAGLVVGDSATDMLSAQTNGVPFLLRRTPINRELQRQYSGASFESLNYE
jgi:phosphoglycolate phosphatase-like HAD superfamily hydrolase